MQFLKFSSCVRIIDPRLCQNKLWCQNVDGSPFYALVEASSTLFEVPSPTKIAIAALLGHVEMQDGICACDDGG